MRFLQKLLTTLVGFMFTMGGFGKVSAQEPGPTNVGTVVIARENRGPSMNDGRYESQQSRLLLLAANKNNDWRNKNKKKTNQKNKTKTKTTKKKPKSPHK